MLEDVDEIMPGDKLIIRCAPGAQQAPRNGSEEDSDAGDSKAAQGPVSCNARTRCSSQPPDFVQQVSNSSGPKLIEKPGGKLRGRGIGTSDGDHPISEHQIDHQIQVSPEISTASLKFCHNVAS